jgi:hypothetical protein
VPCYTAIANCCHTLSRCELTARENSVLWPSEHFLFNISQNFKRISNHKLNWMFNAFERTEGRQQNLYIRHLCKRWFSTLSFSSSAEQ